MNRKPPVFVFIVLVQFMSFVYGAHYTQFNNGTTTEYVTWLDTSGTIINAHDGGILYVNGRYYWYGMALRPLPAGTQGTGGQTTTVGITMYSSSDLYNWAYEGVILPCSTDPNSQLYGPMRFERPKIIYNSVTKQYVLWCHYVGYPGDHGTKVGTGDAGVASCDKINGVYTWHGYCRPIDSTGIVRDCSLFQDVDGSAYFIYDRDITTSRCLYIVKLSADYLTPTLSYYQITVASQREAPAMFKYNGSYFLITSGLSGWTPNQAKYFRATAIFGPYIAVGDPCIGADSATTFNSQTTQVIGVEGKPDAFIHMAERHNTSNFLLSSSIWLPITFPSTSTLCLHYRPTWDLSVFGVTQTINYVNKQQTGHALAEGRNSGDNALLFIYKGVSNGKYCVTDALYDLAGRVVRKTKGELNSGSTPFWRPMAGKPRNLK
jgi:beta-galactosidase